MSVRFDYCLNRTPQNFLHTKERPLYGLLFELDRHARYTGPLALYSEIQIHLRSQKIHYVVLNYKTPNSFSVVTYQYETLNC